MDEDGFYVGEKLVAEKSNEITAIPEYWQTADTQWLYGKKEWAGLTTLAMTRNTTIKDGKETRYFISSLPIEVKEIARAIRGHWMVESYHWHLDVTFREDANHTLEKQAAYNLNIMKKLAINVLKIIEVGENPLSLAKKRFKSRYKPGKTPAKNTCFLEYF